MCTQVYCVPMCTHTLIKKLCKSKKPEVEEHQSMGERGEIPRMRRNRAEQGHKDTEDVKVKSETSRKKTDRKALSDKTEQKLIKNMTNRVSHRNVRGS